MQTLNMVNAELADKYQTGAETDPPPEKDPEPPEGDPEDNEPPEGGGEEGQK